MPRKIVPEARGEAARVRTAAEGYKTASIARATGDATRFSLLLDQYQAAPEVTRKRLWLETVQQVLAENRKVVGGDGRQLIYVPMAGGSAPLRPCHRCCRRTWWRRRSTPPVPTHARNAASARMAARRRHDEIFSLDRRRSRPRC